MHGVICALTRMVLLRILIFCEGTCALLTKVRVSYGQLYMLGALKRVRSQGGPQRQQDPLETENPNRANYNHVTTTNKCMNVNSQIAHE